MFGPLAESQPAIARVLSSMHTMPLSRGEDCCIPLRVKAQWYVGGSEVIASVADAEIEELS